MNRHAKATPAIAAIFGVVLVLAFSSQAFAAQFQFKETFGSANQPTFSEAESLAVDTLSGDLLVMDRGSNTVSRFHPDGTPADFPALGTNVIDGAGGADKTPQEGISSPQFAEIAVDNSGTITDGNLYVTTEPNVIDIFARTGEYLGQLSKFGEQPFGQVGGVAVDSNGIVYVSDVPNGVHKFAPTANPPVNTDFVTTFTPTTAKNIAAGVGPSQGAIFRRVATFGGSLIKQDSASGAVDYSVDGGEISNTPIAVAPSSGHLLGTVGGKVTEYDVSGASKAVELRSFLPGLAYGLAVAASGDVYVALHGKIDVWGLGPAATAAVSPAADITRTTATLKGSVNAEGLPVTGCKFEYGPDFGKEVPCTPSAAQLSADFSDQVVSAPIGGLQESTTYRFRLTVTDSIGTETTEPLSFTTSGSPQIREVRASNADQTSATIEARVNPSGFGTTYRFEWGPTAGYGHQVPAELEPFLGEGHEPIRVSAKLSGLTARTRYHYRVIATSKAGTVTTPDQIAETLNSCGLPDGRCFELVSRREAGPVAIPGGAVSPSEMHFQAATNPGALAYMVEAGYPEATKGAEVLYRGTRGPSGWDSTQISNPLIAPNEQAGVTSGSGNTKFLSNDLSCGFAESPQPLTNDPTTRLVIENGGTNLYRVNPDNSYTAVTKLAPENSEGAEGRNNYNVAGASQDCSKVLFSGIFRYPGISGVSGAGGDRLFEWDEGTLRNVGVVPGSGGENVIVEAIAGTGNNSLNTVSEDGSRIFFTAPRQASPNSEEIGKEAIFVREDGGATIRDITLSQTATPDEGATYQWATPDGSRVFFTANAGLTEESSPAGTDLYEYNLETEELIDRSVSNVTGGAQVSGFVGAPEDGSHVYFISRTQLVPGRGNTLAENQSAKTRSVYGESGGEISFVGTLPDANFSTAVLTFNGIWTSRVSPTGRFLLFQSSANNTGYDSGGAIEAYLYDANSGSEGVTICVSCRQDGQPSVAPVDNPEVRPYTPLDVLASANDPLHPAQFLVMHEGEPQVFFNSPDSLAPGAVERQNNVYEWAHGQVFRLSSGLEDQQTNPIAGRFNAFVGASDDASDVYLFTPETLNWEDGDERLSVYDARVGGGFPEPPAPPAACEAISEGPGSCQGSAQGAPAVGGAASAAFNGPGNPPEQSTKKKSKKKPHKKKHKSAKKKGNGKKQARQANGNRRAGK